MFAILIITVLLQGIPIGPQAAGAVSGVLRNLEGKPAAGVRVSAMTRQEPLQEKTAVALASIAETDQDGRYTIEGIPPGQYHIVAGSIDRPTYYPGTLDIAAARVVQITAGARITGFDFAVVDTTRRMPTQIGVSAVLGHQISLQVRAEPGTRIPVVSPAGPLILEFERISDRVTYSVPATAGSVRLELQSTGTATEYRTRLKNLPEGFVVRSMTYNGAALPSEILSFPTVTTSSSGGLNVFQSNTTQALLSFLTNVTLPGLLVISVADVRGSASSGASGVRVTGIGRRSDSHPVLLSGKGGLVFADGSFEFRGVPPGRHTLALIDSPGRALGTTLIVGDRDIDNVSLDEIAALPLDIQLPVAPGAVGNAVQGTKIPPVILSGVVLDRLTQQPPPSGQAWISGRYSPSYPIDADGRFEIPGLLPGTYKLEVQVAGYATITRDLTVGIEDLKLDLQLESRAATTPSTDPERDR